MGKGNRFVDLEESTSIDTRNEYKQDYKLLQKEWLTENKALLLVGRLAYWTFWISKYAESSQDTKLKQELFQLKAESLALLRQSDYTQIRKFVPPFHQELCFVHKRKMRRQGGNTHYFLTKNAELLKQCPKCCTGNPFHYALYSIAVVGKKLNDAGKRTLYFILYTPFPTMKDVFPPFEKLNTVSFYKGKEYGKIRMDKKDNEDIHPVFSINLAVKKLKENYEAVKTLTDSPTV